MVAEWKRDTMQRTVDELTDLGVPTLGVECDINEREQIEAMVADTMVRFGRGFLRAVAAAISINVAVPLASSLAPL